MRIALVHDYIKEYGGAERVLETLHDMYPDAPVFTLVYCPEFLGPHKKRFEKWNIKTSFLQYVPFKEKFISIYRLFALFLFPLFTFSGYDVVIVSATGAYSPNLIQKGSARQLCYCHTPPRYLYGYATAREWKKNPLIRLIAENMNAWLRQIDKHSSKNVDIYIANSLEVAGRIKKFYGRDSIVVYPPVTVSKEVKHSVQKDFYLTGGRLARPKHFDLIIKTANQLHIPLKIFGKGFAGYGEELQKLAGPTVSFVGEVTDEEKLSLMNRAKAFIMASEDEDFGITPVEAMGVGTPVIAYKSGGLKETVVDGITGVFFDTLTVESLKSAIKRFEDIEKHLGKKTFANCRKQAEKFDTQEFVQAIRKVINEQ